jgi:ABC-type multidrug transport system fused ATPase/permease subunit
MQDSSLFNDTIKNNLLYAKPNATKKEIELALKNAEANFVFDLDK